MVCEKCEKKGKLGKVITPDPWKAGASNTTKPGGRKVGENKLLTASKNRFNPLTTEFKKCRICKVSPAHRSVRAFTFILTSNLICFQQKVHQVGSHYCQQCAYKKGICAMCGVKVLKTQGYRQSAA